MADINGGKVTIFSQEAPNWCAGLHRYWNQQQEDRLRDRKKEEYSVLEDRKRDKKRFKILKRQNKEQKNIRVLGHERQRKRLKFVVGRQAQGYKKIDATSVGGQTEGQEKIDIIRYKDAK